MNYLQICDFYHVSIIKMVRNEKYAEHFHHFIFQILPISKPPPPQPNYMLNIDSCFVSPGPLTAGCNGYITPQFMLHCTALPWQKAMWEGFAMLLGTAILLHWNDILWPYSIQLQHWPMVITVLLLVSNLFLLLDMFVLQDHVKSKKVTLICPYSHWYAIRTVVLHND